jgi:hypothetical protein
MTLTFLPPSAAIWTPKRVFAVACGEIRAVGDTFFLLSGLVGCGESGFEAGALAAQVLQGEGPFRKKLESFIDALEGPLQQAAQVVHDQQPDEFKKRLSGRDALTAILFCKRGDELLLSHIGFKTKKRGKEVVFQVRQKDYPNLDTGMMSVEFVLSGADAAVEAAFLKGATGQQALVHPEKTLQRFMELAAVKQTIHIIKVAETGVERSTLDSP